MSTLDQWRDALPEAARDIRLNLQSVLQSGTLSPAQRWGVAIASAAASRQPRLLAALREEAAGAVEPAVTDDAIAAAIMMGMNNIYYRFRHLAGKPGYAERPPRLRMNRLAKPLSSKRDFELFCLAVSIINGCEACVRAHEHVVLEEGLSEEQVHEAARLASVVHAAAVALDAVSG
jgi:alkyl hydroperoxide reductase subunit D